MPITTSDRAPDTLGSYARVRRPRPVATLINVVEALLSLVGVVILILVLHTGSFTKAGALVDGVLTKGWEKTQALIAGVSKGG